MTQDREAIARELLAEAFTDVGYSNSADNIRKGGWDDTDFGKAALRAIEKALTRTPTGEGVDCAYCGGTGEYFGHAPGCDNDSCALAGGIDDCDGEVQQCACASSLPISTGCDRERVIEDDWSAAAAMYTLDAADAPPIDRSVRGNTIEHASWMLHEIVNGRIAGRKAHRWLGYAQGLLVSHKYLTLEEAKLANKRASDEASLIPPPSGGVEG